MGPEPVKLGWILQNGHAALGVLENIEHLLGGAGGVDPDHHRPLHEDGGV